MVRQRNKDLLHWTSGQPAGERPQRSSPLRGSRLRTWLHPRALREQQCPHAGVFATCPAPTICRSLRSRLTRIARPLGEVVLTKFTALVYPINAGPKSSANVTLHRDVIRDTNCASASPHPQAAPDSPGWRRIRCRTARTGHRHALTFGWGCLMIPSPCRVCWLLRRFRE